MNKIRKLVDEELSSGWKMYKITSVGGLFQGPSFEERRVYTRKELFEAVKEGFYVNEDAGRIALNILLSL